MNIYCLKIQRQRAVFIVLSLLSIGFLSGCDGIGTRSDSSSSVYTSGSVRRLEAVRTGVVLSVREITIKGDVSGDVGTAAGAAIGGLAAGANIGRGTGSLVAGILGAVGGGIAGNVIGNKIGNQKGLEIEVKLDSTGEVFAITQAADESFRPGDRVRILTQSGMARVTRL